MDEVSVLVMWTVRHITIQTFWRSLETISQHLLTKLFISSFFQFLNYIKKKKKSNLNENNYIWNKLK